MKIFDVNTESELSKLLAVTPSEIHDVAANIAKYYRSRKRRKPDGTLRVLHVPTGPLKLLQEKVKQHILDAVVPLDCVHGGVCGRSVITNARPHVDKHIVFCLDIKDFFPSVATKTVQAIFEALGFGAGIGQLLAQITTWNQQLPQGAPTSLALANLSMIRIDVRLASLATHQGFAYTRYVDDLTLSGSKRLLKFRRLIQRIVEEEGFQLRSEKTRTMHAGMRQEVTKLVVNRKLNLPKEVRKAVRRHALEFSALAAPRRRDLMAIRGELSWLSSVNPRVASRLQERAGVT